MWKDIYPNCSQTSGEKLKKKTEKGKKEEKNNKTNQEKKENPNGKEKPRKEKWKVK